MATYWDDGSPIGTCQYCRQEIRSYTDSGGGPGCTEHYHVGPDGGENCPEAPIKNPDHPEYVRCHKVIRP